MESPSRKRKFTAMESSSPTVPIATNRFSKQSFCMQMAHHLMLKETKEGSKNFVFSPLSFHLMLCFLAAGFKGRTLKQLLHFLEANSVEDLNAMSSRIAPIALPADENDDAAPLLSFVNGAWVHQEFTFRPSFKRTVEGVYNAVVQQVDFENKADESIIEINLWIENATKGLIKNLLPPNSLTNITAVVLADALYFKGSWAQTFDASKTQHRSFHLLNGQVIQAPFMTNKYTPQCYASFPNDGYKVVKIPYKTGQDTRQFSMYFFLPDAADGLGDLVHKFKSNPEILDKQIRFEHEMIQDFWIPRFKFSYEFEGSDVVAELGLDLPFKKLLELTEMVAEKPLVLTKMFHKACIEVDEEGSAAAASTVAICIAQCCRVPEPSFVADHPFMFMIKEETSGLVFFTGVVLNPLSSLC